MKSKITWIAMLIGSWLLVAALPVAALIKWDNSTGSCNSSTGPDGSLTSCSPTLPSGGTSLTETAISNTGSGGTLVAAAYVGTYGGGVGVTSAGETLSSPQHAMDNSVYSEFMLLTFGASVSLGAVEIGYWNTDSDITVLAYTGCSSGVTCSPNPIGDTYGGLVGNTTGTGWTLVGNYANLATNTPKTVNAYTGTVAANTLALGPTSVSSSYWLIGAYNNTFGQTWTTGNDYVKLLAYYGTKPNGGSSVPEPSSLLLAGIALFGLTAMRRRRMI